MYEWNEEKRKQKPKDHGVDFAAAARFEWETALLTVDDRENYREFREIAYGFIGDRLHAFTFTRRGGNIRIISLRKATKREVRAYVEATT
jgi:uncharacterized DUF497 family protein